MSQGVLAGLMSLFTRGSAKTLADAEIGDKVEVRGRIVPRDLIESPLTGERCVYYSYSVDEWRPSRDSIGGDGFWNAVERDEAIAEFYLQVGTERLIVAPQRAKVTRGSGPKLKPLDYGIEGRRASEMLLVPGDTVVIKAVLAWASDLFDDARDYRAMPHRHMLRAADDKTIAISLVPR